ncbi:MAG TPA: Cof-type HAD-IIB family hydrolase [Rectinemataceae bacterium]|nr:Cof-type HAD-IIB family hydrolase [Rectinemataceae bacterium]
MTVDLIALDLDDTLLREDLSVSGGNREALAKAEERGIRIVLASGRNIHSMRHYASLLGLDGPGDFLICSNGAEIIASGSGELLDQRRLPPELCREIAAAIEARGFPWQVYDGGAIHVNRPNPWADRDSRLTGQPTIRIEDEEALFARGQVKFVIPGDPASISTLLAELGPLFEGRAEVFTSKPYFLEILSRGADKGAALQRLAGMLQIPMERVMAIGDAMNDFGMIKAAGWGCAPLNALPEIKAVARLVSGKSNEEDAVADLIGRVALA